MPNDSQIENALTQAVKVRYAFDEALRKIEHLVGHDIEGLDEFVDQCALDGGVDLETVGRLLKLAQQSHTVSMDRLA